MKKIILFIFLSLLIYFIYSCTQPETDDSSSQSKTEPVITQTPINTPTASATSPAAPDSLTLDASSDKFSIALSWNDNANNEEGFAIYWSLDGVQPDLPGATAGANTTGYNITNLMANSTYTVWIEAFNSTGISSPLSGTVTTDSGIIIDEYQKFNDTAITIGFNAYLTYAELTDYQIFVNDSNELPADGGITPDGNGDRFWKVGIDTSALSGDIYLFVQVSNGSSTLTSIQLMKYGPAMAGPITAVPGDNNLEISWVDTTDEEGYKVYINNEFNIATATAVPLPADTTTYNFTGLFSGTLYYYWIEALGNSPQNNGLPGPYITDSTSTTGSAVSLISQGKTASDSGSSSFPADNAFDGDIGTLWGPNDGTMTDLSADGFIDEDIFPMWIKVDLEAVENLAEIHINWEGANTISYKIQGSDDDTVWTDLAIETANPGGIVTYDVSGSTARYVRLYIEDNSVANFSNIAWGTKLREIQIFK